ncbi:MAG: hypothetical protein U0Y10_24855 [Spirosomataceae bacterium]
MKTKLIAVGIAALSAGIFYGYTVRNHPRWPGYHTLYYSPTSYQATIRSLAKQRQQQLIPQQADELFIRQFQELLPFWYGTHNDFNGHTTVPGEGSISCAYFVTTLLKDLGVELRRNAWAQLPSERMITNLVDVRSIQRFSNEPLSVVIEAIKSMGKGLYIIGLDTHTGFVLYDHAGIRFIHSSAQAPCSVLNESIVQSAVINQSKYRVLGKLTGDRKFTALWNSTATDNPLAEVYLIFPLGIRDE